MPATDIHPRRRLIQHVQRIPALRPLQLGGQTAGVQGAAELAWPAERVATAQQLGSLVVVVVGMAQVDLAGGRTVTGVGSAQATGSP